MSQKSCKLHNFYTGTNTIVSSWVTHRQIKYTMIRQLLRSCLIWVYFICKRRLKASPGRKELIISQICKEVCCRRNVNHFQTLSLPKPFSNFAKSVDDDERVRRCLVRFCYMRLLYAGVDSNFLSWCPGGPPAPKLRCPSRKCGVPTIILSYFDKYG